MKCSNCGYEIYNNQESHCPNCGENIYSFLNKKTEEDEGLIGKLENANWKNIGIACGICIFILLLVCIAYNNYSTTERYYGATYNSSISTESSDIVLWIFGIIAIIAAICLSKYIKNIVVTVGRKVLDFGTSLDVILSVAIIIIGFFMCKDEYGINEFIWWYIGGAIIFFLVTLLANYTLYVLIDIRDSLKKLADKSDNENNK